MILEELKMDVDNPEYLIHEIFSSNFWKGHALGRPILLGTSRKSTIGLVLGGLPPSERVEGTAATVALGVAQGADIVRVHDVHEMVRIVKMCDAILRGHL